MRKHTELFAYICVSDAAAAIEFYSSAFDASELFRLVEPSGRVGHAEVDIGGNTLMLSEEYPDCGVKAPSSETAASCTLHLHVENVDETIANAVKAGARVEREAKDEFYGERSGVIRDPFGHRWLIGHSIEDISPQEMQLRYTKLMREYANNKE